MNEMSDWSRPPDAEPPPHERRWTSLHGLVICGPFGFAGFFLLDMTDAFFGRDAQMALLLRLPALICFVLLLIGFVTGIIALFSQVREKSWTAFVGVFSTVATVLYISLYL